MCKIHIKSRLLGHFEIPKPCDVLMCGCAVGVLRTVWCTSRYIIVCYNSVFLPGSFVIYYYYSFLPRLLVVKLCSCTNSFLSLSSSLKCCRIVLQSLYELHCT